MNNPREKQIPDRHWTFSFDTNHYVRVRLNTYGLEIYRKHAASMRRTFPSMEHLWPANPNLDKDGFMENQLWSIFSLFGEHMGAGQSPFLNCEIQFDTSEA